MKTTSTESREHTGIEIIRGTALPNRTGSFNLTLDQGLITDIQPSEITLPIQLVLPAFYEPHVHANRAYRGSTGANPTLKQAIEDSLQDRTKASAEEFGARAMRLFKQAIACGTQTIRTHTDVDSLAGLRAIEGVCSARDRLHNKLSVEVIAFATSELDPATPQAQELLQQAIALGAGILGAVPAFYNKPEESINRLLQLAATHELAVDLHLDEHLNGETSLSEYLAEATIAHGLEGKVSLSHGCAICELPSTKTSQVIEKLANARITVISMPATNLYVQDRGAGTPAKRGITLLKELIEAGVKVLIGSDNVQDYFYPYGNADPLEAAYLASLAGHLDNPLDLIRGICNGNAEVRVGDSANLVILPVTDIREAIAMRPEGRTVIRYGKVIAGPEIT